MEDEGSSGQLPKTFSPARMEAFSDGVIAVIITIMVLELRPPGGADLDALLGLRSQFLVYVLSFTSIGIYWNNHHHLLRATPHIDGAVMWANLHLLFWLSLIPATTAWAGEDLTAQLPAVVYGAIGLMSGVAYYILERFIIRANKGTDIERAIGGDVKGKISLVIWGVGMLLALLAPILHYLPYLVYACISVLWFIPDRRLVGR
ncbi:MAG: TMEM175 family protein [Ktedonobacterales bacterium]